jgi:hypothetical protein
VSIIDAQQDLKGCFPSTQKRIPPEPGGLRRSLSDSSREGQDQAACCVSMTCDRAADILI